ncbi:MAG TPA: ABC transporter permease [Gammaproteobacteria bacterium]|nr:ABC transporter permease [Gammaproteobacteria bacterium]
MFIYNLRLALVSLKRDPVLTALMIGAIAVGIGMSTTTLAIYHSMSNDPIAYKSDQLYAVQLDNWSPDAPYDEPNEPPTQVTYLDAMALMRAAKAEHQNVSFKAALTLQTDNPAIKPDLKLARVTYKDFFGMFDVPFQYGGPWDKAADDGGQQVVVVSQETNEKLFGGGNSVGKEITLNNRRFRIVGVLGKWEPSPKFYDLENGSFEDMEDVYIPFSLTVPMELHSTGNNSCWGAPKDNSFQGYLNSECVWIQAWAELSTPAARADYHQYLDGYVQEQKKLGRFARPLNNHLRDVDEWLKYNKVVSKDSKALVGLSFMFLAVCMLNTIGLILAKFLRRSNEIGLRRALGASRLALFRQYLVETSVVGVSGGLLGLGLGWLGLLGVRQLISDSSRIAHLDWTMVGVSLLLAVVASMLAGLYPAWRVVRIPPAIYLKIQ